MKLVAEDKRESLLEIIKAKISGDALNKIQPIGELNTWELLRKRLREKVGKHVSIEYAQEDLNSICQKTDETIEKYGDRVKKKLRALNDAMRNETQNEAERIVLRKVNEKHAISKFEQNLKDTTIKVLTSAAAKSSLEESIQFAMQKELLEKTKNVVTCSFCGFKNHSSDECRKKKARDKERKPTQKNNGRNSNFSKPGGGTDQNGGAGIKPSSTNQEQKQFFRSNDKSYQKKTPPKVNIIQNEDSEEETVEDALFEEDVSKN